MILRGLAVVVLAFGLAGCETKVADPLGTQTREVQGVDVVFTLAYNYTVSSSGSTQPYYTATFVKDGRTVIGIGGSLDNAIRNGIMNFENEKSSAEPDIDTKAAPSLGPPGSLI